ncbi:MAG TPA: sigma-70 family RNA polymerase sigma factor [Caulobacterales bacterium]|nr:sigma-70 family RNA polymerase sigma factor [Caulobacterales bacterium]
MSIAVAFENFASASTRSAPAKGERAPSAAVETCSRLRILLLAGLEGDAAAHRRFLAEAAPLLRAFFRNRLRNAPEDVEDLVQDTLVALHARRGSYDPQYPLNAWMFAIARYRLIDLLRRRKTRMHEELDESVVGQTDCAYEAADARRDLFVLLNRLPPKQQKVIRLVKLEERCVKEAAALTGFSESDIKISVHRGIKTLARLVAQNAA